MTVDTKSFRESLIKAVEAAGGQEPEQDLSAGPLRELQAGLEFSIKQLAKVESNFKAASDYMPGEYVDEPDTLYLAFSRVPKNSESDELTAGRYIYHNSESDTFRVSGSPASVNAVEEKVNLNFEDALAHLNSEMVNHHQLSDDDLNTLRADID